MRPAELRQLLDEVASGALTPEAAARRLSPTARLGFANLDLGREQRTGLPEAVYAESKSDQELAAIVDELLSARGRVLVTRLAADREVALSSRHAASRYYPRARLWTAGEPAEPWPGQGEPIAVISAGTADLAVAEEAERVALWHGVAVHRYDDVGVAGVHRLLERLEDIRRAPVAIVVAGMDGALPSVVAGLVSSAVVAVPTSVGYGASFSGLSALLTMLNSCAPGVAVVNIDNGYGAAVCACRILGSKRMPLSET